MTKTRRKNQYRHNEQSKKGIDLIGVSKHAIVIPEETVEEARNEKIKEIHELNKLKSKSIK